MDPATVGPSQRKHVVKVVGNAEEFFLTVVRCGDGVHQKVGFGGSADDVTVAVRAVTQDGTGHVGAVAVQVFGIITAGA